MYIHMYEIWMKREFVRILVIYTDRSTTTTTFKSRALCFLSIHELHIYYIIHKPTFRSCST